MGAPQYLAVYTHPATVQRVLTQARRSAQLVLARRGVDDLDGRVAHCPVDTEVGCLPWLPCFCVADAWRGETSEVAQSPSRQVCGSRELTPVQCHLLLPRNALSVGRRAEGPQNREPCDLTALVTHLDDKAEKQGGPCRDGKPLLTSGPDLRPNETSFIAETLGF